MALLKQNKALDLQRLSKNPTSPLSIEEGLVVQLPSSLHQAVAFRVQSNCATTNGTLGLTPSKFEGTVSILASQLPSSDSGPSSIS